MIKDPVISLENVWFSYDSVPIIEDANLAIPERDLVTIVGPNGGGKTTLLKLVLGILTPSRGTIRVFGDAPSKVSHRIGYVPQHRRFDPSFPVSVLDVVLMGRVERSFGGFYQKRDRIAACEALDEVGLIGKKDVPFAALSGGERQRVLIARALVSSRELLLFDEPTSHLDSFAAERLYELFRKLNETMTIVFVSHDVGLVTQVARTVVCVNHRVLIHPTCDLTGEILSDIYGGGVALIHHNHRCSEAGHTGPARKINA